MNIKNIKNNFPNGAIHGLIAGHGGVINGEYQILKEGTKQHKFSSDGFKVYEGEQNRYIKNSIKEIGEWEPDLEIIDLNPTKMDTSLKDRVHHVNNIFNAYKEQGKLLLVWEIHNNAFKENKAEGTEVFTTPSQNFSDKMATVFMETVEEVLPNQVLRRDFASDGDADKEALFYLIRNIWTFGCLAECFFFDNRKEVEKYCNPEGYAKWAEIFLKSMRKVNKLIYEK